MSRSSDFMRIAKDLNILPIRISKYCMSTLSLHPNLNLIDLSQKFYL